MNRLERYIRLRLAHWGWALTIRLSEFAARKRSRDIRSQWIIGVHGIPDLNERHVHRRISNHCASIYDGVNRECEYMVQRIRLGEIVLFDYHFIMSYLRSAWLEAFDAAHKNVPMVTENVFTDEELVFIRNMIKIIMPSEKQTPLFLGLLGQSFLAVMDTGTVARCNLKKSDMEFYAQYLLNILWKDIGLLIDLTVRSHPMSKDREYEN